MRLDKTTLQYAPCTVPYCADAIDKPVRRSATSAVSDKTCYLHTYEFLTRVVCAAQYVRALGGTCSISLSIGWSCTGL